MGKICWWMEENIFHGYGALEFEGGRKYVGEFKDGMPAYEFETQREHH